MTPNVNEKIYIIISRIESFPDLFKINVQKVNDVENYLKNRFNCKFIPKDFISFMNILDGLKVQDFNIFSVTEKDKDNVVMTFENYSKDEDVEDYLNTNLSDIEDRLLFFASDNAGGRFAFKTNVNDEKIYYLSNDNYSKIVEMDNFLDLLFDKINLHIENKI